MFSSWATASSWKAVARSLSSDRFSSHFVSPIDRVGPALEDLVLGVRLEAAARDLDHLEVDETRRRLGRDRDAARRRLGPPRLCRVGHEDPRRDDDQPDLQRLDRPHDPTVLTYL